MVNSNHLVLGLNGNIGSALFKRLQATKTLTAWGTTQRPEYAKQDQVFYLNLLDDPATWSLPTVQFDTAYLCAGICRMALCEDDPIGTARVNIDGMKALIQRLMENNTFIVYLSTNQVFYGDSSFVPEGAPYQPLNEYGRQKSIVEAWIQAHCARWAIVRLTKVVEPNMALIQQWIEALRQHQSIDAFHDMALAPVSLRQVIDVLMSVGQQQKNGIYQVSGAEDLSYQAAAQYLAKRLSCPESLVKSVSALDKGIKKNFLPRFTTLSSSSTIALCGQTPPAFSEVVQECFNV